MCVCVCVCVWGGVGGGGVGSSREHSAKGLALLVKILGSCATFYVEFQCHVQAVVLVQRRLVIDK